MGIIWRGNANYSECKGVFGLLYLNYFWKFCRDTWSFAEREFVRNLCAKINFAEKNNFVLHVFHLKMKISVKLNKVKSQERKQENKIGRESSIFYCLRKGFNNKGILCMFFQKEHLWLRLLTDIGPACIEV